MGTASSQARRYDGICCLFEAINKNRFDRAKQIIARGLEVNCINYNGATPLIEVCRTRTKPKTEKDKELFVQFLLENGSDPKRNDIFGWTAVLYAKQNGNEAIASLLEESEWKLKRHSNKIRGKEIQTLFHLSSWI